MHKFLSPIAVNILNQAGWYPERQVPDKDLESFLILDWPIENTYFQTRIFPAAFRVLKEFVGVRVPQSGPGKECHSSSFEFDVLLARKYAPTYNLPYNEWTMKSSLYPLGIILDSYTSFGIDFQGRILDFDEPEYMYGYNIYDAINRWVEGVKSHHLSVDNADVSEVGELFALLHQKLRNR